ncbi:phage tail sheath family protein [Roseobacteraceae bacterium S113]
MYQHPGVYIEHVPSGALAIEAASTSVAAFIGPVNRGGPVNEEGNEPVFVSSVSQYANLFGPLGGGAGGVKDYGNNPDLMGLGVNAFFSNGGTKAYILPLATSTAKESAATLLITLGAKKYTITVTANSPGTWGDDMLIELTETGLNDELTMTIGTQGAESLAENNLAKKEFDSVLETLTDLSVNSASPNYIATRVGDLSNLVTVAITQTGEGGTFPARAQTLGGKDTGNVTKAMYVKAYEVLEQYRDVSIICMPDLEWPGNQGIYSEAITHCEKMQNRMVIVNCDDTELTSPKSVSDQNYATSPYAALYYPQMTVANPYYDADLAPGLPKTFVTGPGGFAAGLWARIDGARGVWKAPAGLEATVRGALGPTRVIGNAQQDNLNEWGVNCLRSIIGPTVIWGARTLATKVKPQYRYIPVRRTQNMIGESLYRALQAVVFEPNDHKLWSSLRGSVGDFMDGLHRAGAFQGAKASDAYFVQCGLGSTMTQGDIDAGIVRVSVGFAPLKPAEFVVVQISQKVGQGA